MFEVVLVLPFQFEATPDNPMPKVVDLYKTVQMMALPPVGTHLLLMIGEDDIFIDDDGENNYRAPVELITWDEREGGRFHLRLEKHVAMAEMPDDLKAISEAGFTPRLPPVMWF